MKKTLIALTLILTMIFSTSLNIYAQEMTAEGVRLTPEEKFEARIEKMTERHETNIADRTARFEEGKAKALERQAFRLTLVAEYAEDLYEDYAAAFEDHVVLHEALHTTRISYSEEAFDTTIDGLTSLKDDLVVQVEAGDITWREAHQTLKAYFQSQRQYYKEVRDQYQADIEGLNEANEANKEAIELLKEDLRAAIEAGDDGLAKEIIAQLYDYLILHTTYDRDKLMILEAVEF